MSSDRFSESAHQRVGLNPGFLASPRALLPEQPERVRLVYDEECAVAIAQFANGPQIRPVPVHAEVRLGDDPASPSVRGIL